MAGHDESVLLDGGLSTALEEQGADLGTDLWTARLLAHEPERIAAAHRAFFAAGAQVATTASYQASVPGFVAAGMSESTARDLIGRSVQIAREVRDERGDAELKVAASVGPYGAYLADGSEYRGRYGVTPKTLRDFHAPRLELLAEAGPDLIAVETIPDLAEAEVLVPLLADLGLPAWFCFSVADGQTRAGQSFAEAFALLADCPVLVAAGVNCSDQREVLPAAAIVSEHGLPVIAYPNRGGAWNAQTKAWDYGPALDPELVASWPAAGVGWIGGCCGVGPSDIEVLAGTRVRGSKPPPPG